MELVCGCVDGFSLGRECARAADGGAGEGWGAVRGPSLLSGARGDGIRGFAWRRLRDGRQDAARLGSGRGAGRDGRRCAAGRQLCSVSGSQRDDLHHAARSGVAERAAVFLFALAAGTRGPLDMHRLPQRRTAADDRGPLPGHPGDGQPVETGRVLCLDAASSPRIASADPAAQGQPRGPVHRGGRGPIADGDRGRNVGCVRSRPRRACRRTTPRRAAATDATWLCP
jgi:hypothetical protein